MMLVIEKRFVRVFRIAAIATATGFVSMALQNLAFAQGELLPDSPNQPSDPASQPPNQQIAPPAGQSAQQPIQQPIPPAGSQLERKNLLPGQVRNLGLRDNVIVRVGYMSVKSAGVLTNSDTLLSNLQLEYDRMYTPRFDIRIGGRFAQNSKISRMQVEEFLVGTRYYPLSLATDFAGPVASYSLRWKFAYKPYVETQGVFGHYVGSVIGDPPVYDLASDYMAVGFGAGCKFQIMNGIAIDVGFNYQKGMGVSVVVLDPTVMHAFVGIALGI